MPIDFCCITSYCRRYSPSHVCFCVCNSFSLSVSVFISLPISVYGAVVLVRVICVRVKTRRASLLVCFSCSFSVSLPLRLGVPLCLTVCVSFWVRPNDDDETNSADKRNYSPLLTVFCHAPRQLHWNSTNAVRITACAPAAVAMTTDKRACLNGFATAG